MAKYGTMSDGRQILGVVHAEDEDDDFMDKLRGQDED